MNAALQGMLDRYRPQTLADHENALQEIVQELALLGLWRAKFFEHAAFYGGTALRIFHSLPRFSEDIDFSLLQPDREFDLAPYLEAVRVELAAFGFSFRVERRIKRVSTAIESAFIKGGTRINLAHIGTPDYLRARLPELQQVRIRIELDTDPPSLMHAAHARRPWPRTKCSRCSPRYRSRCGCSICRVCLPASCTPSCAVTGRAA